MAADWRLQSSIQYNGYYDGSAWDGYQQNAARANAAAHYGDMLENFYDKFYWYTFSPEMSSVKKTCALIENQQNRNEWKHKFDNTQLVYTMRIVRNK